MLLIIILSLFALPLSVPRQIQVARLIQAVMNSVPANADVHVEFSQDPNVQEPRIEIEHIRIAQEHPLQAEQRSSASTQPNSAETRNSTNSSPERGNAINQQSVVSCLHHKLMLLFRYN